LVKVSLILTVKNESNTIPSLFETIANQTRIPDEVVVVDGGSSDNTVNLLKAYSNCLPVRVIVSPGANIAHGRNLAIENASYEIIASTDGGCKLDHDWLRNLIAPFESNLEVEVVSGVYRPLCETEFQEVASCVSFPEIKKLQAATFLPSSRSVAFKKYAWQKAGGYPEWLTLSAEDTLFDLNLRKKDAKFALASNAIVYWKVRSNGRQLFRQYYNYARGDGEALLFPFRYGVSYALVGITILLVAFSVRFPSLWLIFVSFVAGFLWIQYLRKIKNLSAKRVLIAAYVASIVNSASFLGYIDGLILRLRRLRELRKNQSKISINASANG
jgi:glycosyltransferase involved in cell wall biosynthesis